MTKKKKKSDIIQSWLPRLIRLHEAGDRVSDLRIKILKKALEDEVPIVIGLGERKYRSWMDEEP